MAIQENHINELEKRIHSFKGMVGVYNSKSGKLVTQEGFPKSPQTYPNEIITLGDTIKFHTSPTDLNDSLGRRRTWVTSSIGGDYKEKIANGYFSESHANPSATNPYVEMITMPLTMAAQSDGQFYTCFAATGSDFTGVGSLYGVAGSSFTGWKVNNNFEFDYNNLAASQSFILKNFLPPFKYGGAYQAQIYQADTTTTPTSHTAPNYGLTISPIGANNGFEGWVFDYKEGFLLLASSGPQRPLDVDGDGVYEDYNTSGSDSDDGVVPNSFPAGAFRSNYNHPLYIQAYRYFGPTGFSDPNLPITASFIKVIGGIDIGGSASIEGNLDIGESASIGGDLDVGGNITFSEGFTFTAAESIVATGSNIFGDDTSDTHQFTGSVLISGSLLVNGSSTIGTGGGGAAGINPILVTNSSSLTKLTEYKTNRDYYNKNVVKSTDNNDIVEYIFDKGLFISASEGETNYIMPLGSASLDPNNDNPFLPPNRTLSGDRISTIPDSELNAQINFNKNLEGGATTTDLFRFSASTDTQDFPNLLSYAKFSVATSSYTTHSFGFSSSKAISKIGIYYSNNSNDNPQTDTTFQYIEQVILEGSNDGATYEHIYSESGINQARLDGNIYSKQYIVGTDPEFTLHGSNEDSSLSNGDSKYILNYTSSEFYTGSFDIGYTHYRLYISGGVKSTPTVTEGATPHSIYQQWLHHIDLHENLKFVSGNRKQITIGFDNSADLDQSSFSKFDIRISESFQKLGIVAVPEPEAAFFFTGVAQADVNFNNNNAFGINHLSASLISSSNISNGGIITTQYLSSSTISTNNITVTESINNLGYFETNKSIFLTNEFADVTMADLPSSSVILKSLNPIYFTTRTINGTVGVDQHSGRIFGHSDGDVNNLYIDGYRLFNIADTEIRFKTHHPTLGKVVVSASKGLQVSGTISASGITSTEAIYASNFFDLNGAPVAGGAGFPFDGDAQLTGSLIISQSTAGNNPHIQLFPIPNEEDAINTANEDAGNILWNKNGSLYWGTVALASPEDVGAELTNAIISSTLTSSGDSLFIGTSTFNGDITASGNISASGLLFASTSNASGNPYLTVLINTESGQFYYTGSYGGGGGEGVSSYTDLSNIPTDIISSSTQIATEISGAFFDNSSSFSDRIGALESGDVGDFDWHDDGINLTSSKGIKVEGNVTINEDLSLSETSGQRIYLNSLSSDATPTFISSPSTDNLELRSPKIIFSTINDQPQLLINSANKGASFFTGNSSLGPSNEAMLIINGTLSSSNDVYFPNLPTKKQDFVVLWEKGTGKLHITGASSLSSTNTIDPTIPYDFDIIHANEIHVTKSIRTKEDAIIDGGRAIIGLSGSIQQPYNEEKITNYFDTSQKRYSLYVRNGVTVVGGDILPDAPDQHSLGSKEFPFRGLHIYDESIHFYSGSSETSGSAKHEISTITVNTSSKVIEFKSGSEFQPIQVKEINIGSEVSGSSITSSVQISGEGQGFVAVHAEAGKHSTIFRAEHPQLTGDLKMGSITQKGSGSFAILLDADQVRGDAKLGVYSNTAIPGTNTPLLTVSESGETRAYDYFKANNYITTTNITASNNISASGNITIGGDIISKGNIISEGNVVAQNYIISSSITHLTHSFSSGSTIFGDSSDDTHQFTGSVVISGDITATSFTNITASNISSNLIESTNEIRVFSGSTYHGGNDRQTVIRDSQISLKLKGGTTQIRAEDDPNFGDKVTGGIIQKGSGSFEILLDADASQGSKPHFGIRSNTAIPGTIGTKLFTVSESFETRVHNGGLRADNYVTTTNITASGNISGSHVTTASFGSLQLSNLPTSPTGLPTGSVWVSGSKNDTSTNNVNCGTLMIVI